jgi:hypothetical protein
MLADSLRFQKPIWKLLPGARRIEKLKHGSLTPGADRALSSPMDVARVRFTNA